MLPVHRTELAQKDNGTAGGSHLRNNNPLSFRKGLQRTVGSGGSGSDPGARNAVPVDFYSSQIVADSRKNSFSAPDEVFLERKGSADSQTSFGPDRIFAETFLHSDKLPEESKRLSRTASDKSVTGVLGASPAASLLRGGSRLAAEVRAPDWLSPANTRPSSIHNDADVHSNSEILAHIDQEQSQVVDSLQHLHLKLDKVVQHLGISIGHKPIPSLISAHHGSAHQPTAQPQHDPQVDSLISQVEATLQHPTSKSPAITPTAAELSSRSESNSIGAAVRKQLDLVGEQLANKGHASPPEADNGRLVSQVSSLSEQLHAAQAATAAAQQEAHHLKHKQQELASLREQLLAAEVTTAGAVKEAAHLRQQLRSLQRTQSQATPSNHAELTTQVMPVIDLLMKDTYTALRDEFQFDVMYKGIEIEHVLKSTMRKQVLAGQQAVLDLASQQ